MARSRSFEGSVGGAGRGTGIRARRAGGRSAVGPTVVRTTAKSIGPMTSTTRRRRANPPYHHVAAGGLVGWWAGGLMS
jgi:hypothetical protein